MFAEAVIGSAIGSALVSSNKEIKTELSEIKRKISNDIEHCEKEISAAVNTLFTACHNNFDVIKRLQILTIYGAHKTSDGNLEYIDGNSKLFYDIVSDTLYMYENDVLVKESRKDGTTIGYNNDYKYCKTSDGEISLYCKDKLIYSLTPTYNDDLKDKELREFYYVNGNKLIKKLNFYNPLGLLGLLINDYDRLGPYLLPQTVIYFYLDISTLKEFNEYSTLKKCYIEYSTLKECYIKYSTIKECYINRLKTIKEECISELNSHRYSRKERYSILTSMRKKLDKARYVYNNIKNNEKYGHIIEETDNILKLFK